MLERHKITCSMLKIFAHSAGATDWKFCSTGHTTVVFYTFTVYKWVSSSEDPFNIFMEEHEFNKFFVWNSLELLKLQVFKV